MSVRRIALALSAITIFALLLGWLFARPSNQKLWAVGQENIPAATFAGSTVAIRNLRNFEWKPDGSAVPRWETRTYDLDKLRTAWFILAPFDKDNRGPAHTFLSFGFADSQYVAVSVEARRERDEEYSLLKGALRRFEIMYVVGDERDLIRLRTNVRGDQVYVYPIRATPQKARALFVEMLQRANHLNEEPEFYNTLTNNCTTNILEHANSIAPGKIPYGREVLLPGYADELAQRLKLIDDDAPIEQVRARYLVNARARTFADDPEFSTRIRSSY